MKKSGLGSSAGFTYLAVLMLIVVMGVMLGAVGESMQMVMKREREEELLFRGGQIVDAIERWKKRPASPDQPLNDLKYLLKDPRTFATVRYLRKLYTDPMTGKEWVVISDPQKGIVGVRSASEETAVKQADFPEKWKQFEGKTKYNEWEFVLGGQVAPASTVKGIKTTRPNSPFGG